MALPDYTQLGNGFTAYPDFYRPRYQPVGLPSYNADHPFLDPNYAYGGNANQQQSEYFDLSANQDPQAYYALWLAQNGYDDNSNRSKLARGLYDRFQQGYAGAQLLSPELQWTDYLSQQNLNNVIGGLSYENQGIDVGRYQGRDRWGLRGG